MSESDKKFEEKWARGPHDRDELPGTKAILRYWYVEGFEAGRQSGLEEAAKAKLMLLRAVVELDYCRSVETLELVDSAEGRAIIAQGMVLLGLKDLSEEATKFEAAAIREKIAKEK